MSFSDVFYPGNPERRNKVVRLTQKIFDLMEGNFDATNDLIELMNLRCGTSIVKIKVNQSATLRDNSYTLKSKIAEIQREIEKIRRNLRDKLEPTAYDAICNVDTSFEKTYRWIKNGAIIAGGILGTAAGIAATVMIAKQLILVNMVSKIGTIATCAVAGLVITVVLLGVDMIISAIVGAQEREKLEGVISDLERVLQEFEPASKQYTRTIYKVLAQVEIALE